MENQNQQQSMNSLVTQNRKGKKRSNYKELYEREHRLVKRQRQQQQSLNELQEEQNIIDDNEIVRQEKNAKKYSNGKQKREVRQVEVFDINELSRDQNKYIKKKERCVRNSFR